MARSQKWILLVIMLIVAGFAAFSSVTNPLFESPDELQHYQFVHYLVNEGTLPVQLPDAPPSQSHQPPLYYWAGAQLVADIEDEGTEPQRNPFWAYDRANEVSNDNKLQFLNIDAYAFPYEDTAATLHRLRLFSTLLSLGTVFGMWLLGTTLWPTELHKVLLMLAIGALNPMFLYISGAANNDAMIMMWGALLIGLAAKWIDGGFSWLLTIGMGIIWSAALLSKLTGVVLAPAWAIPLVWLAVYKRQWRASFARGILIVAVVLLMSGWWFWRNWLVYSDLLALQIVVDVWGARPIEHQTAAYIWLDVKYSWRAFWGQFGYGQMPMYSAIYSFFGFLVAVAAAGMIKWLIVTKIGIRTKRQLLWLTLGVVLLGYMSALFYYINKSATGANGRYLFPALAAFSAIMTASLSVWTNKTKWQPRIHLLLASVLAGIAAYIIFFFLPAIYARPTLLTSIEAEAMITHPANVEWENGIVLLGTAVSSPEANGGETITITACWQANAEVDENYVLFVRLLDRHFNAIGQRDTFTGLGTFPTTFWQVGDIFCDQYLVDINGGLSAPVVADIDLGFYEWGTGKRPLLAQENGTGDNHIIVNSVKINPDTPSFIPPISQPVNASFEQGVTLLGYNLSADEVTTGTVEVELIWGAEQPLDASYTIFIHLLDSENVIIAQADDLPADGNYPTTYWGKNEIIVTHHTLLLQEEVMEGESTLVVGFYQLENFVRLPRIGEFIGDDFVELQGPLIVHE